jgi:alanine racemase
MYGLQPSAEWEPTFGLHPALALKSRVVRLHQLEAGVAVGYGRTFIAQSDLLAALAPVGYGDGYHRALSNKGFVLIRGRRAPIIGCVSMDQIVVDVTGIDGVQQDDEVVLVGSQEDERISNRISAEEVAALAGTINYEVTTSLLPRVVRAYRRGGEIVEVTSLGDA